MTVTHKKRTTKKAQLIKLRGAKSGADVQSLSDKLGWQPHTTRAALSNLRKAGYAVARNAPANGGAAKYRISSAPKAADAAPAQALPHGA